MVESLLVDTAGRALGCWVVFALEGGLEGEEREGREEKEADRKEVI